MPLRIEDYALIGDCQTAALVGRDGSIDWLCIPRFDSAACFAALLGTVEHGRWQIAPAVPVRAVRRRYRPGTLVLETEFETDEGVVVLTDCMPMETSALVRMVEGKRGAVPMRVELVIRPDFGSRIPWVRRQSVQRARRGVSRTRRPSSNATTRGRACDQGASRPTAQDGHASRRAASSASARSGSRYSSTPAQLSDHARHAGRGRPAGEGGVRVAPWPRSDRLTSRRAISARVRQPAQPPRPATTPWPAARSSVVTLSSHTIRPTRLSPTTTREHRR